MLQRYKKHLEYTRKIALKLRFFSLEDGTECLQDAANGYCLEVGAIRDNGTFGTLKIKIHTRAYVSMNL